MTPGETLLAARTRGDRLARMTASVVTSIGAVTAIGAFLGTMWLIAYVAMRPGGIGNMGDKLIASFAFPAAACGIAMLVIFVGNFVLAGLMYFRLNGSRARRGRRVWSPETRVECVLFSGLALATIVPLVAASFGVTVQAWWWPALLGTSFAVSVLFVLERYRWRFQSAAKNLAALTAAGLLWLPSVLMASALTTLLFTEGLKGWRDGGALALPVAIILLAASFNYRIAVSGSMWSLASAVFLVGMLAVYAPVSLSAFPFRVLRFADYTTTVIATDKGRTFLAAIEPRCSKVTRRSADEYEIRVLSSLGDDFVALCNPSEWIRISKAYVDSERGAY